MQHEFIGDERINLARHELGHAFLAHMLGFHVHGLALDERGGSTEISYPLSPNQFEERYAQTPLSAAVAVARILAVIRAGSFVELWGEQWGLEPCGRDMDHIQQWRDAVLPCYGSDGWVRIYAESYRGLIEWYRHASVRAIFRELGPWVAQQESVSRYALLSALDQAGAGLCPDPTFHPVLPPARRSPAPSSAPAKASSRPARLQIEIPAMPRAKSHATAGDDRPAVYSSTRPLHEDAHRRIFALDYDGERSLYRIQTKATGRSIYVLARDGASDGNGKARLQTEDYGTEFEARRHMRRQGARQLA
jgi:hypothetical protein